MTQKQQTPDITRELSEAEIRIRSYLIWERDGKPDGMAEQHWLRALAELREELPHSVGEKVKNNKKNGSKSAAQSTGGGMTAKSVAGKSPAAHAPHGNA